MADASAFNVHDVAISEQPKLLGNGTVQTVRQVEFFVGVHGPFTIQDSPDVLTGAEIKRRIDNTVVELRIATEGSE